jgi:hypothetical protein
LILYNIYVVTCWYILGYCFSTPIEEWLEIQLDKYDISKEKKKDINPEKKSFISIFLEKQLPNINKSTIKNIFSVSPMISTFVCLLRLYYMKK